MEKEEFDGFTLYRISTGGRWKENSYLVVDQATKNSILIDPGYDSEWLIAVIEENGYSLKHIILTHAHHDHIAGVQDISEYFCLPCILHPADKRVLMHAPMYGIQFAKRTVKRPKDVLWLDEAVGRELANEGLCILHTPGHSKGGICVFFRQLIFTGDTLVREYLGRTDLPEGDREKIIDSVNQIFVQAKEKSSRIIYPGHGERWGVDEAHTWWQNQIGENIKELNMF